MVPEALYFLMNAAGLGPLTPASLNLLFLSLRLRMVRKCEFGKRESIPKPQNLGKARLLVNPSMGQVLGPLLAPQ